MSVRTTTGYARRGKSFIGYQVMGDGPMDVVLVPDGFVTTEPMNDEPSAKEFLERIASYSRLILFDRTGTGISDPATPDNPPTLELWVDDALAVLDALGSERAALIGLAEGYFVTSMVAATHPQRVTSMVLVHPVPGRSGHAAGQTVTLHHERLGANRVELSHVDDQWRGARATKGIAAFAPSKAGDEDYGRWLERAGRLAFGPSLFPAMNDVVNNSVVDHVLPSITAPTLVLHRAGNRYVTPEYSRFVASSIPNATYVELPGADHVPYLGDTEPLLGEMEEFLTGARHVSSIDRVLATVLFSDIVASTERAAALGDAQWRAVLDRHDGVVRRSLDRYRGRLIKSTGDGVLATFDGPARACACACAMRRALRDLGLETRHGIHTGEIELRGEDVGGIAVNIAARVEAAAPAGEVYVSGSVPPLVVGAGVEFEDRGQHDLKGVPGSWRLFAVLSS